MKLKNYIEKVRSLCQRVKPKMRMDKDSVAIIISIIAVVIAIVPFLWNDIRKTDSAEVVILNLWVKSDSKYFADMIFVNKGNTDLVIAEISLSWKIKKRKPDGSYEYKPGEAYMGPWFTPEPFTLKAGEVIAKNYEFGVAGGGLPHDSSSPEAQQYSYECYLNFILVDHLGMIRAQKVLIVKNQRYGDWFSSLEEFPMKVTLLPAPEARNYFSRPRKELSAERKAEVINNANQRVDLTR